MLGGHILGMAKARSTTKPKAPRAQHPRLVGFSEDENTIVERAAELEGTKTNVYIREAALSLARRRLMGQAGGGR
jgi:N-dimethylarginine dimethylaminohydrolase